MPPVRQPSSTYVSSVVERTIRYLERKTRPEIRRLLTFENRAFDLQKTKKKDLLSRARTALENDSALLDHVILSAQDLDGSSFLVTSTPLATNVPSTSQAPVWTTSQCVGESDINGDLLHAASSDSLKPQKDYLLTCDKEEIRALLQMNGSPFGSRTISVAHLLLDAWPHIDAHPALTTRIRAHSINFTSNLAHVSSQVITEHMETQRRARATISTEGTPASEAFRSVPYPHLPSEDIMKSRLLKYIEATSNSALSKEACGSCGGSMFLKFMRRGSIPIHSIPNAHHLQPPIPHRSHKLINNLLLCSEAVKHLDDGSVVTLCLKCWDSLKRNSQPTFALAKGFWVGAVPPEISCLNMAEQLLIQLEFPRIYLVKLMPKKKNSGGKWAGLPPDQLMDGMKGSVCSVHMPTTDVIRMLEGSLAKRPMLPNPTWVLSHTLSLAFLGFGKSVPYHLRGLFTVNRRKVMLAIQTLKAINPLYENVEWNEEVLDKLPPEAVPDSVMARSNVDRRLKKLAELEGVGYVRIDEDEDDELDPEAFNGLQDDDDDEDVAVDVNVDVDDNVEIDGCNGDKEVFPPVGQGSQGGRCAADEGDVSSVAGVEVALDREMSHPEAPSPSHRGDWRWDLRSILSAEALDSIRLDQNNKLDRKGGVVPDLLAGLRSSEYIDMDGTSVLPNKTQLLAKLSKAVGSGVPLLPRRVHLDSVGEGDPTQIPDMDDELEDDDIDSNDLNDEPEHPYGLRIGTEFANSYEPETWAKAYPHLYPYAIGMPGYVRGVGLKAYFRWAITLKDPRFRIDKFFLFDIFSTQQKREVSLSARLAVERSDWDRLERQLRAVSPDQLAAAVAEETKGVPITNPVLREFFRVASAVQSRCLGSDSERYSARQEVWGISTVGGNVSVWLTVNPADQHDPVGIFLAGEDIDLDDFCASLGPNATERSRCMASNAYASAEYFHVVISAVLEHLLGVVVTERHVSSEIGVLGLIRAYLGMVEAQGRSNLHGHFLLWLANTPHMLAMAEKYKDPAFLDNLNNYVRRVIHAHVEGLSEDRGNGPAPQPHPSWARPPNPSKPDFDIVAVQVERDQAETSQFHKCTPAPFGCARYDREGNLLKCSRGSPFPLSDSTRVFADGTYYPERHIPNVNAWNPDIHSRALRCNGDIKMVMSGSDTKNLSYYFVKYFSKAQDKSFNMSAMLVEVQNRNKSYANSPIDLSAHDLLVKFVNMANSRQEIGAPLAIATLMGWAPKIASHRPRKIFLGDVHRVLRTHLLKGHHPHRPLPQESDSLTETDEPENVDRAQVLLNASNGTIVESSQLTDYAFRGCDFSHLNLVDFSITTYNRPITPQLRVPPLTGSLFRDGHPSQTSQFRSSLLDTTRIMPNFVGASFASSTDLDYADLYHASMLVLYCPWNSWDEVLAWSHNWKLEFDIFFAACPSDVRYQIINTQLRRHALSAADRIREDDKHLVADELGSGSRAVMIGDDDDNDDDESDPMFPLDDMRVMEPFQYPSHVKEWLQGGLFAGQKAGLLDATNVPISGKLSVHGVTTDNSMVNTWKNAVADVSKCASVENNVANNLRRASAVLPGFELFDQLVIHPEVFGKDPSHSLSLRDIRDSLNREQQLAFDIVTSHLQLTLTNPDSPPPQLLLKVLGAPGTGKSRVIDALTEVFKAYGSSHLLTKVAHQGSAACNVGGQTICSTFHLNTYKDEAGELSGKAPGTKKVKVLMVSIGDMLYLIIDEISMVSYKLFADICSHMHIARPGFPGKFFAAVHVAIFGDFHQNKPVGDPRMISEPPRDSKDYTRIAHSMYKEFTTAVELTEQIRVSDPVWQGILGRMRYGSNSLADIDQINALKLKTGETLNGTTWGTDSILLTARNCLRDAWNSARVTALAHHTKQVIFLSPAFDTVSKTKRQLNARQAAAVASLAPKERGGDFLDNLGLVVGMECMITSNVLGCVQYGIANGSRGIIVGICLHPADEILASADTATVQLSRPPLHVLFKPHRPNGLHLPGLEPGIIPVEAATSKSFTVRSFGETFVRHQLPLVPAYSLTMLKSQGQTIRNTIIDPSTPAKRSGPPLSLNELYVGFSRSSGRDSIRLLRRLPDRLAAACQRHVDLWLRNDDALLRTQAQLTRERFEMGTLFDVAPTQPPL